MVDTRAVFVSMDIVVARISDGEILDTRVVRTLQCRRRSDDDRPGLRRRRALAGREAVLRGDWLLFDLEKLPVPFFC